MRTPSSTRPRRRTPLPHASAAQEARRRPSGHGGGGDSGRWRAGPTWASEARPEDAGALGAAQGRTVPQRVSHSRHRWTPAPAARACVTSSQVEALTRPPQRARQDDGRSDRRGAADGGSESRSDAPVGQAFVDAIPPPVAQGGWLLGLFTALLTITRKSDCLRAVWDGDRL
jgi:hypothetical protein